MSSTKLLEAKIKVAEVQVSELESLKKGTKVYKQQHNSNVLFLCQRTELLSEVKHNLDQLKREHSAQKS